MADESSLLDKLNALHSRFVEVGTLIADPNVIGDQERYVKLTKEYKDLEKLMATRDTYKKLLDSFQESKIIMLNESDQELKDMAREELAGAVQAVTKLHCLQATFSVCIPNI